MPKYKTVMITFPNAKINLGLNIVSKRADGYHNLETIFYPVPVCDALEIVPAKNKETTFTGSGLAIEGETENNLVMKAYRLLEKDFKLLPVDIYLRKNIPFGAGLGGGSSDAAFMLKLLNEFNDLNLSSKQLEEYASRLGADCAFFIRNKPVFAEGIGDEFSNIELSLKGYSVVIIKPDIFVSTKEAYAGAKPQIPEISLQEIAKLPVTQWKDVMKNDFEKSLFPLYPEIENSINKLYEQGAVYASMSGSGSAIFGIFADMSMYRCVDMPKFIITFVGS